MKKIKGLQIIAKLTNAERIYSEITLNEQKKGGGSDESSN